MVTYNATIFIIISHSHTLTGILLQILLKYDKKSALIVRIAHDSVAFAEWCYFFTKMLHCYDNLRYRILILLLRDSLFMFHQNNMLA